MLNLDYLTFPVLRTDRLILRRLVPEYAIRLHQLRSDAEINRYLNRPPSASVSDALAFISKIDDLVTSKKSLYWVITLSGDNTLIGTVCLWNYDTVNETIELGYELMTDQQGKGLMAEAVAKVIEYGFNHINAKAITAFTTADNTRSVALLKKLNFTTDLSLRTDDNPEVPYILRRSQQA